MSKNFFGYSNHRNLAIGVLVSVAYLVAPPAVRKWMTLGFICLFGFVFSVERFGPSPEAVGPEALEPSGYRLTPLAIIFAVAFFINLLMYGRAYRRGLVERGLVAEPQELPPPQAPNLPPPTVRAEPTEPEPSKRTVPPSSVYVPTYVGGKRPHNIEVGGSGATINDRRPVDPEVGL